jgi:hypothetical protein
MSYSSRTRHRFGSPRNSNKGSAPFALIDARSTFTHQKNEEVRPEYYPNIAFLFVRKVRLANGKPGRFYFPVPVPKDENRDAELKAWVKRERLQAFAFDDEENFPIFMWDFANPHGSFRAVLKNHREQLGELVCMKIRCAILRGRYIVDSKYCSAVTTPKT